MKRDDDGASAGRERSGQGVRESGFDLLQFAIDGDPQRLEDARGGMFAGVVEIGRGDRRTDDARQIGGSLDGINIPGGDQCRRDGSAEPFFAILAENAFELSLFDVVNVLCRRFPLRRIEPQVERSAGVE